MIFAEVHGSRTFVGCLDHGSEVIASLLALSSGDECRKRQPRETVAGQETFAGEVAVTVEIGLNDILTLG